MRPVHQHSARTMRGRRSGGRSPVPTVILGEEGRVDGIAVVTALIEEGGVVVATTCHHSSE